MPLVHQFKFSIVYHPGTENTVLSHLCPHSHVARSPQFKPPIVYPGVTYLFHFTRARNLPFSLDQIRSVTNSCISRQYLKPKFITSSEGRLIKAIPQFQQLNIDFKGPLSSLIHGNKYLPTVINKFSHFPFVFPCKDMTGKTVTHCLDQLFSISVYQL